MKKYTRKGLIRFYEKLPPMSRPCKHGACPIAVFMGPSFIASYESERVASTAAMWLDQVLADCIDSVDTTVDNCDVWPRLTAAEIVELAKAAPHV